MMTEKLRLICGIRAAPSPCICLACKQGKGTQCIRPYSKRIASGTFFSFRHQSISCPRLQLVAVSVSIGWRGLERRRETFLGRASKQAPFSSPSQVTVSGWTQQGTRSGPARPGRPGWWWLFAPHSPARPRPGTCRSAAGTRGPRRFTCHPPPAAVSRRFLPPTLAACARLISLSARGFLARALPAPLPLAVSPPASSPEAACDDRPSAGSGARSTPARAPPTSRFLGSLDLQGLEFRSVSDRLRAAR